MIIFVTGGARSGKSDFAQDIAEKLKGKRLFLATAQAFDEEMRHRIQKHRENRPSSIEQRGHDICPCVFLKAHDSSPCCCFGGP